MKTKSIPHYSRGVAEFVARHADDVTGVVHGFDRLRFQGTLRPLYQPEIMAMFLQRAGVLWKDFKGYVCGITGRIRASADTLVQAAGLDRVHYLRSSAIDKEHYVAELRRSHGIESGLIAVLSCVEPCRRWDARGNRATKRLELRLTEGRCGHLYFYFDHPKLGLMHLRLQTWFPFCIQVCANGREWLARELTRRGIAFTRDDNCLPWIEDVAAAQQLLNQQVRQYWPGILDPLVTKYHPVFAELQKVMSLGYYWTMAESEYAIDVMFRNRAALQRIYPALVHHSIMSFGAEQVLRFFGRQSGPAVEVNTTRRRREEGVCVKHWLNRNSQKAYDKYSILRCEGTMNDPADFRVWRAAEGKGQETKAWRPLRRTVADVPRRAEVMLAWGDRQLGALATVHHGEPLATNATTVCRPVVRQGRRYRALNPFGAADAALLAAVNRGEFVIGGLRNRDVRALLYPKKPAGVTKKQLASRVSRQLSLLRAHGLIARLGRSHRYKVTAKGRTIITAFLAAAQANIEQLTKLAA